MSHSCGLLPLDVVSRLEVLIRAGGTDGVKDAGGTRKNRGNKSLIHQWPVCCHAASRLYQSSSNSCLKRIPLSCFTWEEVRLPVSSICHRLTGCGCHRELLNESRGYANNANNLSSTVLPFSTILNKHLKVSNGITQIARIQHVHIRIGSGCMFLPFSCVPFWSVSPAHCYCGDKTFL